MIYYSQPRILLCTNEYEKSWVKLLFSKKYESDGGARGKPRGPGNTTLWVFFKRIIPYTRNMYTYYFIFFFQTFSCYRTKGFSMPIMSARTMHLSYFESFRIIHLELDIVTVGLVKNICYQPETICLY